ncbi:hypothetical protein GCM10009796_06220 [Microbacterium koreense]
MLIVALCVVVVVTAMASWLLVRGSLARAELEEVLALAGSVRSDAAQHDVAAAEDLLRDAHQHAESAAGLTSDPIWRLAHSLPFVGDDLAAVGVVSRSLADITGPAVPLLNLAGEAVDGGVSTERILGIFTAASEPLHETTAAMQSASDELARFDDADLIPQVADGVSMLSAMISEIMPLLSDASDAADAIPLVFGSDEPTSILLMVQNGAEVRTGGGIAGTFVLLEAHAGDVRVVRHADSSLFSRQDSSIIPLDDAVEGFFGGNTGRYVQNSTVPPDFAVTGELVSAWWADLTGDAPDVVLSLDVPAIASLVDATGPLVLPDGSELAGEDLVDTVLVEAYRTLDRDEQTEFQKAIAGLTVARLLEGEAGPLAWLGGLAQPISEGRVSIWSSDPTTAEALSGTVFGGTTARLARSGPDAFGVYFNDATAGKMDAFLDVSFGAAELACASDDVPNVSIAVTMTNKLSADAVGSLPWWVTGDPSLGHTPGDIVTLVSVSAPEGWFIGGVFDEGTPLLPGEVRLDERPTTSVEIALAPGETRTIDFRFSAPGPAEVEPVIVHTPLLTDPGEGEFVATCR